MSPRPVALLAALLLSAGTTFAGVAPPTDAEVDTAIKAFQEKMKAGTAEGASIKPTDRVKWADESLEGLDLASLSNDQVSTLVKGGVVPLASKSRAIAEQLAERAKADTVEGAEAAALRIHFMNFEPDQSAQQAMLKRAITHPELQAALKAGKGYTMFPRLRSAKKDLLPDLLALEDVFTTDMPPEVAARSYLVLDAVVGLAGDDDVKTREPLRLKLLELVRTASKQEIEDESLREALANAEKKLDGAFMKGQLLGHPAPELTITWTSMQPAIKSLADLKGKVVVIDFWATWCGPCVASFPDVKKLQSHYEGYPVVILGVTSIQGMHVANGQSIDCKGDPDKEMELMHGYIKEKEITWPIAFAKENVFNPEYGVTGIPHVVIIDTKGVVRHRKLHPNSRVMPLSQKVEKIDALLKEAGLPTPPPLPADEPKEPSKGG